MPVDMAIELAKAEFDGVLLAAVVRGLREGFSCATTAAPTV